MSRKKRTLLISFSALAILIAVGIYLAPYLFAKYFVERYAPEQKDATVIARTLAPGTFKNPGNYYFQELAFSLPADDLLFKYDPGKSDDTIDDVVRFRWSKDKFLWIGQGNEIAKAFLTDPDPKMAEHKKKYFLKKGVTSNYSFFAYLLSLDKESLRPTSDQLDLTITTILLTMIKNITGDWIPPHYSFETGIIKGFQANGKLGIRSAYVFTPTDNVYTLALKGFSQEETDTFLSSIMLRK